MIVQVDPAKCIGAGQCVLSAPEVFDQDEETGLVVILDQSPAAELHRAARRAMQVCPAAAIHLAE